MTAFAIEPIERNDLNKAASLCVGVFFGETNGNPIRSAQLSKLEKDQFADLAGKLGRPESSLFKILAPSALSSDTTTSARDSEICGFVELTVSPAFRYLGEGVPVSPVGRPVLSNLAVAGQWRRRGMGAALVDACERDACRRGFSEMILQVEEDNTAAQEFYATLGYDAVYCDRAAQRYDVTNFVLRTVRTSRITMKKEFPSLQRQGFGNDLSRGVSDFLRAAFSLFQGTQAN